MQTFRVLQKTTSHTPRMKKKINRRQNSENKANRRQTSDGAKIETESKEDSCKSVTPVLLPGFHGLNSEEMKAVQTKLLAWYDTNKRDLPWRQQSKVSDTNQRAYGVWVSEIMLQQTQVATVINYYNKWMKKWPCLQDLSDAKLEEVNEMWSGLGYYSRGKRLHEGAQKVVKELKGEMPRSCADLQKELPGVGRYTAGAIASIALGQKTGVVDGNVIRVMSRLRMIGADSAAQTTVEAFWSLANGLADCDRPGDLNQGLMELGATVCTPKLPQCSSCPLSQVCKAYTKVVSEKAMRADRLVSKSTEQSPAVPDIECLAESCSLCMPAEDPWDVSLGVKNFPRKAKKKALREQTACVCVVRKVCQGGEHSYLLLQRPQKGLLAGLWEFPSYDCEADGSAETSEDPVQLLRSQHGVDVVCVMKLTHHGQVVHIFSHIHQTYVVSMVMAAEEDICVTTERPARWVTKEELDEAAVPIAMKKVFKLCCGDKAQATGMKRKREESGDQGKQRPIDSFFKRQT